MTIEVEHYDVREPPRMTAKQYLEQARWLDRQINSKLEQIASLRALLRRCTQSISSASGGGKKDWTETAVRLTVLEESINADVDRLLMLNEEIPKVIAQLPDAKMRCLLEMRYINGYGWNKIARKMAYGRSTVFAIHDEALSKIEIPKK